MTKEQKQKKSAKLYKWQYKDRKHTIEISINNPDLILFEMGYHQPVDAEKWNKVILSRVQKQLKQYLYNYLSAKGFPIDSYILILEGAKSVAKGTTFIDMKAVFPTLGDMEANKAFCDSLTKKMYMMMNQMIKLD